MEENTIANKELRGTVKGTTKKGITKNNVIEMNASKI